MVHKALSLGMSRNTPQCKHPSLGWIIISLSHKKKKDTKFKQTMAINRPHCECFFFLFSFFTKHST